MRAQKLEAAWRAYLLHPPAEQCLLKGAILISKWEQVHQEFVPCLDEITRAIDQIAARVTELVLNCPPKSAKKTIAFINQVMYVEIGFLSQTTRHELSFKDFYIEQVKKNRHSFIFCILSYWKREFLVLIQLLEKKRGSQYSLAIVYLEVAKRLGITCEAFSDADDVGILLRWTEFPGYNCFYLLPIFLSEVEVLFLIGFYFPFRITDDPGCAYIDAANIHRQINRQDIFRSLNPFQIIERISRELTKQIPYEMSFDPVHGDEIFLHSLRLSFAIHSLPNDRVSDVLNYAKFCAEYEIHLEEAIQFIDQVT